MSTNAFNFGPVLDAIKTDADATLTAVLALTKAITDLVSALGGGDQSSVDAVTTALQTMASNLSAAVGRDEGT